jgi:hypothetical protein
MFFRIVSSSNEAWPEGVSTSEGRSTLTEDSSGEISLFFLDCLGTEESRE